ncbi:hypothetical protein M1L60_02775 [Actinoplanes sp. TRM 88003]|uniref:Methyl-accepting chemotaxis protein n=1 Tax=Paractinoplanes aksuensis TaxID=2939490 RepID=A0ABT1DHE9_9ACTN|nr:hypothetical protein [Actinoplanes aksuensis]MCO8269511.1 hypothetical protein [Actinoplanes aksuensis]
MSRTVTEAAAKRGQVATTITGVAGTTQQAAAGLLKLADDLTALVGAFRY